MKKILLILISLFVIGCDYKPPARTYPFGTDGSTINSQPSMLLTSSAFENEGNIPSKYTCDGENISPPLIWSDVPENTKSFVLIVDDPDAVPVAGFVWDHWVLFNIPAETRAIAENTSVSTTGINSFGKLHYGGPCPPNGQHTYFFKLYALDSNLDFNVKDADALPPSKKAIENAMIGHILDQAELKGKYDRRK